MRTDNIALTTVALTVLLLLAACGGGGGTKSYTVTATAGAGGSVTPVSITVVSGSSTTISISLNDGYEIADVSGCGGTVTGTTYTTGPITAACAINATFRLKKYTVTATASTGGSITPASLQVEHGARGTFTLSPASGYKISAASGCGGALAGSTYTTAAVTAACTVTATFALDTPFAMEAISSFDFEPLYQEICGAGTSGRGLQHVIPGEFSGDNRTDLIAFLWCSPVSVGGTYYEGPTPNRLVVLVQSQQGVFENKTREVFGTDRPDIGGASDCFATSDFNNDGLVDVVFSVKREDGRQSAPPTSINYARSATLISDRTGSYRLEFFGEPQWGECVYLLDNAKGGKDFFLTGIGNSQWTYDGGWKRVQETFFAANVGVTFFDRAAPNTPSTAVLSPSNGNPDIFGVYVYQWSDGRWNDTRQGGYRVPAVRAQKFDGRQILSAVVVSVDGKDYVDAAFGGSCQIRKKPNAESEAVVAFNGLEVVGGYAGQIVDLTGPNVNRLFGFRLSSTKDVERSSLNIANEKVTDTAPNRMRCFDINEDGFEDIVLYASTYRCSVGVCGKDVTVYLNDRSGQFSRVKPEAFPSSPESFGGLRNYTFADVNSDGINDLIYFQIVGETGRENRLRIHLGVRQLDSQDLL